MEFNETVDTPLSLMGQIFVRSSLFHSGPLLPSCRRPDKLLGSSESTKTINIFYAVYGPVVSTVGGAWINKEMENKYLLPGRF